MKRTLLALAAATAVLALDAQAFSLFGSSASNTAGRMKSADRLLEKADQAFDDGKYEAASNTYERLVAKYRRVEEDNPEYQDGLPAIRIAYCLARLAECGTALASLPALEPGADPAAKPDEKPGVKTGEKPAAEPGDDPESAAAAFKAATGEKETAAEGKDAKNEKDDEPEEKPYDPRNFVFDFNEAREQLDHGNASGAIELLVPLIRHDPGNRQVRMLLAAARIRVGQHDQAIAALEDLRGRREDLPLLLLIGGAYAAAGRYPEATLSLEAARKLAPADPDPLTNLAWLALLANADAAAARREAAIYYREALKRGGAHDPTLDALLR